MAKRFRKVKVTEYYFLAGNGHGIVEIYKTISREQAAEYFLKSGGNMRTRKIKVLEEVK